MLLGCIGDDFTGSSDIANTLAVGGMSVTQYNGIPAESAGPDVEAGIVSLKSRTAPLGKAVEESLSAANWLLEQGCEQIFFKYCSTFDSTPEGNIGPVADALSDLLDQETVLFCPAFPATGRTVYQGNLFVDDVPLHESGMKDHPLTPMSDSDLRRWLRQQTGKPVKHLPFTVVRKGASAIRKYLGEMGAGYYIADAVENSDLAELGSASVDSRLLTGGSGLAIGLPANFRQAGKLGSHKCQWQGQTGSGVVLSGSCSNTTRNQVAAFKRSNEALEITAKGLLDGSQTVDSAASWVLAQTAPGLVYTSADPAAVRAAQGEFGQDYIAERIEGFFAELAVELVARGVERIVSAGGETSGAIVTALGVSAMQIGPEIAPGVPALRVGERDLVLALKSGNFGGENFFEEALEVLAG